MAGDITWLRPWDPFPPTSQALGPDSEAPGLLAAGASVTPARLEAAYSHGIFPWFNPLDPPMWWAPDPRMVLPVAEFKLSHSLRKTLRRFIRTPGCEVRIDSAFRQVMQHCASALRGGQHGTWIVDEILEAYGAWHDAGRAHSVETWIDGTLVGGLYGVGMGSMVFGESMFAHRTDASKIALAALVAFCRGHGITLIDCQQRTSHLASFGAREIPRRDFETHLSRSVGASAPAAWAYHPRLWQWLDLGDATPAACAQPPDSPAHPA